MMIVQLQREFRIWRQMVPWLTEHCGSVLNSKPIVYWRGRGWELSYERPSCWQVTIDDLHVSSLFLLRWS
jgi:hypothetical protein